VSNIADSSRQINLHYIYITVHKLDENYRFRFSDQRTAGKESAEEKTGFGGPQARLSEDQLRRETEISFTNKQVGYLVKYKNFH
jgi:hypothetical protein